MPKPHHKAPMKNTLISTSRLHKAPPKRTPVPLSNHKNPLATLNFLPTYIDVQRPQQHTHTHKRGKRSIVNEIRSALNESLFVFLPCTAIYCTISSAPARSSAPGRYSARTRAPLPTAATAAAAASILSIVNSKRGAGAVKRAV